MYERLNRSTVDTAAYRISRPLTAAEIKQISSEVEGIIATAGKVKIMIDLKSFPYADLESFWQDLKFDVKHADNLKRLALLGGSRVEQWSARTFALLTRTECRCFPADQEQVAWEWLVS